MDKPEALLLAESAHLGYRIGWQRQAAAELRRLHELLEAEQTLHQRVIYPELQRLRAQRDALLGALKYHQEQTRPIQRTLDVIKAVEGEKNNGDPHAATRRAIVRAAAEIGKEMK